MKGEAVYFYAFDVSNEIIFERIRSLLGEPPQPFPLPVGHGSPKDVLFRAPLATDIVRDVVLFDRPARLQAHVYSIGVISIAVRVPFEIKHLTTLLPFHHPVLQDGRPLDVFVSALCGDIVVEIASAIIQPSALLDPEAYTVFSVSDLDGESDTTRWLAENGRTVAALLTGLEPRRLSETQVTESLRQQRSLETSDLTVIDWDAALVVDLEVPVEDVLYVLEVANLQLEEFRMMDHKLDRYLNRAYEDLEKRAITRFGVSSSVLRKLRRFRVDVTRLADEVTHITKHFGDWYLARVYQLARERFHLDQWRASVEGRLAQLDRLYSVVHADLNERRMFWLELIIVIFFAIELLTTFWLKK